MQEFHINIIKYISRHNLELMLCLLSLINNNIGLQLICGFTLCTSLFDHNHNLSCSPKCTFHSLIEKQ